MNARIQKTYARSPIYEAERSGMTSPVVSSQIQIRVYDAISIVLKVLLFKTGQESRFKSLTANATVAHCFRAGKRREDRSPYSTILPVAGDGRANSAPRSARSPAFSLNWSR